MDFFLQGSKGSFYMVEATYAHDGSARSLPVVLGHQRWAGPKLVLLARCSLPEDGILEISACDDGCIDVLTGGSMARFFFKSPPQEVLPVLQRVVVKQYDIANLREHHHRVRIVGERPGNALWDSVACAAPAAPHGPERALQHWQQMINSGVVDLTRRQGSGRGAAGSARGKVRMPARPVTVAGIAAAEEELVDQKDYESSEAGSVDEAEDGILAQLKGIKEAKPKAAPEKPVPPAGPGVIILPEARVAEPPLPPPPDRPPDHPVHEGGGAAPEAGGAPPLDLPEAGRPMHEGGGAAPEAGGAPPLDLPEAGRGRGRGRGGGRGRGRHAPDDGYPRLLPEIFGREGQAWLRVSPNTTNGFQDIRAFCPRCGVTRTRTCKPNAEGRTTRARSAGRVLGHVFAYLRHDCNGQPDWHRGWYPDFDARRAARIALVAELGADHRFNLFADAERPVHPDLDDASGEPFELANR